ncbi:SUMO-interacting motif-containing protein 1 [Eleginops maclovinus]|uniref:SUMO-interacting motif-containing protein 1 n=1 Tax=Eleginops maclovinus TaxID=56733 RepID=UPI00307FE698
MDEVITISSDSDKDDDSDVEIVSSFTNVVTRDDLLPLSAVRVDVDAVKAVDVPTRAQLTLPAQIKGAQLRTQEHSTHEGEMDDFRSSNMIPSPTSPSLSQDKAESSLQREVVCCKLKQMELDKAESTESYLADHPFPNSPPTGQNPSEHVVHESCLSHTSPICHDLRRLINPATISENTPAANTSEGQSEDVKADDASNNSDIFHHGIHDEPFLSVANEDMDGKSWAGTYRDFGSPGCFIWEGGSDGDEVNKESRFDMDFRAASREDRRFVCPIALRKRMSGHSQALPDEEDEGFGTPEVLCRHSLSVVYATIDEKLVDGTLQLLSNLIQPGYYPPKDITSHLLRGVLLDQQCQYHLCVQAFNLLMRTQRHHMADKTSAPWDWELLTSVMANQDHIQRHLSEVVRMFLDYVVQTLEDDFQAKCSISALHHSIAKATLSCDEQFPHVREIIKWLFAAIKKSTEPGESKEAAREKDEQIRIVFMFQRMLTLALEVDRSPAQNSAKLSQELFHILISNTPLRAQRMLLLESLQSRLLRYKLLELLLDYSCPVKIQLPMSLSLLLHFLKHCTLAPDPSDGTERWQRWKELVQLLWMLLLSYNKTMIGYLSNSVSEQKGKVGNLIYRPDDIVSKPAICEAMEAFRSRSQADLGQTLPLHVEESLAYLQDRLLDFCRC